MAKMVAGSLAFIVIHLTCCNVIFALRRNPVLDALKEKMNGMEKSLSADITLLRDDLHHMYEELKTQIGVGQLQAPIPGHEGEGENEEPDAKEKQIHLTAEFEDLSRRLKRAFSEEKRGIKEMLEAVKAGIETVGRELTDTIEELRDTKDNVTSDFQNKFQQLEDNITRSIIKFMNASFETNMQPKINSSLSVLATGVTKVTETFNSGMTAFTVQQDKYNNEFNSKFTEFTDDFTKYKSALNTTIVKGINLEQFDTVLQNINSKLQYTGGRVTKGKLRLVNISEIPNGVQGRLEVFYDKIWGTVCDDNFASIEAKVACRALGFKGNAIAKGSALFGKGEGVIWMDDVACTGSESCLFFCDRKGAGRDENHNCGHNEDVGLICYKS